jgi:hypothetical protein
MAQMSLKNSTVYLWYGGGAENYVALRVGEGNISWSQNRTIEYTLDRGRIEYVDSSNGGAAREGDDQPVNASFDLLWDWSSAASPIRVLEGFDPTDGTTPIDSAHSADACAPHAVTIEIVYAPTCDDDSAVVHYIIPYFRYESLNYDIGAGQISCSGTAQVKKVVVITGGGTTPIAHTEDLT